jgi:cysteine sulfinate desulfinase/cysteine desulfurase-like protein
MSAKRTSFQPQINPHKKNDSNICVSGGSACLAGATSHVLAAIGREEGVPVRFSFSKYNTVQEVEAVVGFMEGLVKGKVVVAG